MANYENNLATSLVRAIDAGATTSPLVSLPSIEAPFYIALDATNINSRYEVVLVSSKSSTNVNHGATTYAHTTDEEVRVIVVATALDTISDNLSSRATAIVGTIKPYAGAAAPTGYLLCNGSAVSRTTYADLFAIIGEAFGVGDGVNTFNLPNSNGSTFMGYNPSDTAFDTLGETGGAKTLNLQHSHTANNHTHVATGNSGTRSADGSGNGTNAVNFADPTHVHVVTVNTGNQTDTGSNNQLSTAQSIMMPYFTLNWIIKT